jgi:hypothetical protein
MYDYTCRKGDKMKIFNQLKTCLLRHFSLNLIFLLLLASISSAQITTDSVYLRIDGVRLFLIGAYSKPSGVELQEVKDAGFNFTLHNNPDEAWEDSLYWSNRLGNLMCIEEGEDPTPLIERIDANEAHPALLVWHAPDEPAWVGMSSEDIMRGYNIVKETDDYYPDTPHPVWMNHAPRGTHDEPDNFELLKPYNGAADIIGCDIISCPPKYS